MKINEILPQEGAFTEVLSSIVLMPKILYYYGKLPEKRVPTVAIVGSRKNTAYGREIAYRAAYECAKAGAVVVSGLAYGIDSVAHRGALDAGGVTIAVLGTAINKIYPTRHIGLAREIVASGGAIMSEYDVFDKGGQGETGGLRFLARNRIISGLSDVVLIAEAAEHSGSLNTASHALDQGREVFAAPGNVTSPLSEGCNRLIAKGANPYLSPADLISALFSGYNSGRRRKRRLIGGSPAEKAIYEQISSGVSDGEEIVERAGISAQEFSQAITMLEIRDVVMPLGMNKWAIK